MKLQPFSDQLVTEIQHGRFYAHDYFENSKRKTQLHTGDIVRLEDCGRVAIVMITIVGDEVCRGVLVSLKTFFATEKDILIEGGDSPVGLDMLICTWMDMPFCRTLVTGVIGRFEKNIRNGVLMMLQRSLTPDTISPPQVTETSWFHHCIEIPPAGGFTGEWMLSEQPCEPDWSAVPLPILHTRMVDRGFVSEFRTGPIIIDADDDRLKVQEAIYKSHQWICTSADCWM